MIESQDKRRLAEAVRDAAVRAAQSGYEQAAVSGLCGEGALEVALDAVRQLDVAAVIARVEAPSAESVSDPLP